MTTGDNPFERYGLDPSEGIESITQRLKELAEDAQNDAERDALRQAWEALTMHPAERFRAAMFAQPETRAEVGSPPPLARTRRGADATAPRLRDIAPRPSALVALGQVAADADAVPALEDDPLLDG